MKEVKYIVIVSALMTSLGLQSRAQIVRPSYISLKKEMEHSIHKGNKFLKSKMHDEGYWQNKEIPAYTALALTSIMRAPKREEKISENSKKVFKWLLTTQKENGGFYVRGLANYNTATVLVALTTAGKSYKSQIIKGRRYLIGLQQNFGENGEVESPYNGGIGYGGTYKHSDLSNTSLALEALSKTETYVTDSKEEQNKLNWGAALKFISRCQNLKETNDQPKTGVDGSLFYFPGNSKAGTEKDAEGRESLRGYGSMSYAGLMSMIYAKLDERDVRVKAVTKWLSNNYTTEENPGLGQQGLYYYYHVMSKALSAAKIDYLITKDGKKIDWRSELAKAVLTTQQQDGSWINKNSRWWENEASLVTSYAVMTLENIYDSIP